MWLTSYLIGVVVTYVYLAFIFGQKCHTLLKESDEDFIQTLIGVFLLPLIWPISVPFLAGVRFAK